MNVLCSCFDDISNCELFNTESYWHQIWSAEPCWTFWKKGRATWYTSLRCVPTSEWRSYDCKACANEAGTIANVLWLEVKVSEELNDLVYVVWDAFQLPKWRSYDCKACPNETGTIASGLDLKFKSQRRTERLGICRLRCLPTSKNEEGTEELNDLVYVVEDAFQLPKWRSYGRTERLGICRLSCQMTSWERKVFIMMRHS